MRGTSKSSLILAACAALTAGQVMGASATWVGGSDADWATDANWSPASAPGNNNGSAPGNVPTNNTSDVATFGAGSNLQVNPDLNRRIAGLVFDNAAGNYIIGPSSGGNTLYMQGHITGNNNSTITFNSPIETVSDGSITTSNGQVFNFNSVFTIRNGLTSGSGGAGTINFNAGVTSSSLTDPRANLRISGSGTVNVNAPSPADQRATFLVLNSAVLNLNASGIVYGSSNGTNNLSSTGTGKINVNAADSITGTAGVGVGLEAGGAAVVTINHDQSYTGRLSAPILTNSNANKRTAGTGIGTVVGNVTSYDPDSANEYPALALIGPNGYTVSAATTGNGTLWVNNSGSSHVAGGSATGNSDVNIVTGTLGGDGFIVNTDVTIDIPNIESPGTTPRTFAQGVTLHKRQQVTGITTGNGHTDYYAGVTPGTLGDYGLTATGAATYGKLSPGASAGEIGTLTMDLGSKGLNIAYAVEDTNTQTLLFDLDTPGHSDLVNLLGDTVLHIGDGGLELDDFAFTFGTNFGLGTYTLFSSTQLISGTLGTNVSGTFNGLDGELKIVSNQLGGQSLVLAVPEPGTLGTLAIGALGLLVRRRRGA